MTNKNEIQKNITEELVDPLYGLIRIGEPFASTLTNPEIEKERKRLQGIKSLGLIFNQYPAGTHTKWEHYLGMFSVAGQITDVINTQGLDIDIRHLKLAADAMTNTGEIKGVTRMGIIAQKSSILARATFEMPIKQFVNATIKGNEDKLTSVIENIILNQPVPIGTGLPGLLVKVIGPLVKKEEDKKVAKKKVVEGVNK